MIKGFGDTDVSTSPSLVPSGAPGPVGPRPVAMLKSTRARGKRVAQLMQNHMAMFVGFKEICEN